MRTDSVSKYCPPWSRFSFHLHCLSNYCCHRRHRYHYWNQNWPRSKFPSKVKNVRDLNQSLVLKSYNNDHTPEIDGETGMALNYAGTTIMAVFVPGLLLFMTSQVLNLHFAPTDNPILFKEKGSSHCWRDHELDHGRIVYLPNCSHREGFSSKPLSTWKFQVQSCEAWVTGRRGFRW